MKAPEELNLSPEQGESLIERLENDTCTPEDRQILVHVLRLYFWLIFALQESKLSLKRLRTIIFGKPNKRRKRDSDSGADVVAVGGDEDSEGSDGNQGKPADAATTEPSAAGETDGESGDDSNRPGHGRLAAEAYVGAERVECRHEDLAPGTRCPLCGHGTLYQLPPSRPIRIDGHAVLSAIRYELERLRCSACGQVFTAQAPAEAGESKYNTRARAAIVMNRYFLGVPFYRLQAYQALVGVPVPDATQWQQVERVADSAYMVFEHLVYLAAQGQLIYQDDTPVRILSLIKENAQLQDAQDQPPQDAERLVAQEHAGAALAERERLVIGALRLAHHEEDEAADHQQRQQPGEQQPDPRVVGRRVLGVDVGRQLVATLLGGRLHVGVHVSGDRVGHDHRVHVSAPLLGDRQLLAVLHHLGNLVGLHVSVELRVTLGGLLRGRVDDRVQQRDCAHHEDEHHDPVAHEFRVQTEASVGQGPDQRPAIGASIRRGPGRSRDSAWCDRIRVGIQTSCMDDIAKVLLGFRFRDRGRDSRNRPGAWPGRGKVGW